jgi:hypothetical protein
VKSQNQIAHGTHTRSLSKENQSPHRQTASNNNSRHGFCSFKVTYGYQHRSIGLHVLELVCYLPSKQHKCPAACHKMPDGAGSKLVKKENYEYIVFVRRVITGSIEQNLSQIKKCNL